MRQLFALFMAALLCSCGSSKPTVCHGIISPSSRNAAEISAIKDAIARNRDRCGPGARNCDVIASVNDNDQILVGVHFLVPSDSSGFCAQRIGDEALLVYTKAGRYIESIPGM